MPTVLGFSDILAQLSPTKPEQSTPRASAPSTSGGGVMGVEDTSMEDTGTKYCAFLVSCGTNYCGAKIGSGATFCIRPAVQCTFKSHAVSLDKILSDDTYYVAKSSTIAFTEPRLDAGWVMGDLADSWKGLKLSAEDWTKRFDAAHRSRGAATKAEVDKGLEEQKRAKLFQTPSKIRPPKGSLVGSFSNEYSPYKPIIEDKDGDNLDTKNLTTISRHLEAGVFELGQQTEELSAYTQGGFDMMVQATQMVEEKARDVERQLGKALTMPAPINAPTIWGILGLVGEEVKAAAKRFAPRVEVEAATQRVDKLEETDQKIKDQLKLLQTEALETLNAALAKIKSQEEKMTQLEGALSDVRLQLKLDSNNFGLGSNGGPNLDVGSNTQSPGRLTGLEERIAQLESHNDESAIKFSKLGIRNTKEVNAWVSQSFQHHRYGLVVDVYTFLERVAGDSDTDQAAMLNLLDKQMKLKLSTGSEALTLCGLRYSIPRFFHNHSMAGFGRSQGRSFLSKLPNYDAWSNPNLGMKQWLIQRMTVVRTSLHNEINNVFGSGSVAYQVAVDALSRSVAWIRLLISFVDRTWEQLHILSGFSEEKAWELLTQLVARVFTDMGSDRDGVFLALRHEDEAYTCGRVLWAIFKTHDRMEEYAQANIEDHPSISSEYVKFLASNAGRSDVSELAQSLAALRLVVDDHTSSIATAGGKSDTASNRVAEYKKEFGAIQRRITALEKKAG